ncbi:hypothetical protein JCM6882_004483 [Rhodosporidiobolus microsporus]
MVSFCCEQCNDTIKKPKLDQHAGRCYGAQFTCIDCNTTFQGTSYRAHTSCVSEEQRYHKSVYKPPKGKGAKAQKQQQQNENAAPASPAPAPVTAAPAPTAAEEKLAEKKRAREEESAAEEPKKEEAQTKVEENGAEEEPKKKKSKKDKKKKSKGEEPSSADATSAPAAAAEESLSSFLSSVVPPLLTAGDLSLGDLKTKVLAAAKEKGRKEAEAELEGKLWEGLKVGGKKGKVRAEFA